MITEGVRGACIPIQKRKEQITEFVLYVVQYWILANVANV